MQGVTVRSQSTRIPVWDQSALGPLLPRSSALSAAGVISALDHVPAAVGDEPPHRLYNLGNNHPESLLKFVEILERELGRKSIREMLPMQLGDVTQTYADIKAAKLDLGFAPITTIEQGLPQFVAWFRSYHGV